MDGYGSGLYGTGTYGVSHMPTAVSAAYASGAYGTRSVLWRADRFGNKIDMVPTNIPVQGTISFNEDMEIKRSFSLDVNDPSYLQPFRDYIIPEITVTRAGGITDRADLGLYVVTPPSTSLSISQFSGSIEGRDVTWVLATDVLTSAITIDAGTDTGSAAREIARAVFPADRLNLPDTGIVLANSLTIEAGTSRLKAMTDLYGSASWYAPYSDGRGIITTMRYIDSRTAQPNRHYSTRTGDVTIIPPLNETPDWGRLANRVIVRNIAPEREPIFAVADVTNPESPVHPDRLGTPDHPMYLSRVVDDPKVEDIATAQLRADSLLSEGASWYRKAMIRTVVDIHAGAHDMIELDVHEHGASYTGLWKRRTWSLNLKGLTSITDSEVVMTERWD